MGRTQGLADGAHILVLALELKGRGARDDAQIRDLRQRREIKRPGATPIPLPDRRSLRQHAPA